MPIYEGFARIYTRKLWPDYSRGMAKLFPELIKRYAKLRGYRSKEMGEKPQTLNLDILNKNFEKGEKVSPRILLERRIIRKTSNTIPQIKICSGGEITKALVFENCLFSEGAKKKISKAGGEIK